MKRQTQSLQLQGQGIRGIKSKTSAQLYLQQRINAAYTKHNAYTNQKCWQQIIIVILFILQITLHSVFVAPYIYQINNQILSFFFILNYFILCAVVGHYVYLTITDPVDSLIVDVAQRLTVLKNSKQQTVFCIMCQKTVKKTSKHCYQCGRCTQQFDHHCTALNNCIGLGNYQQFIRLLLFYQLYNVLTTVQSIWVLTQKEQLDKGGNIFLIILCLTNFIFVLLLLVFHCYLNCFVRKSTFQFYKDFKHRKYQLGDQVENKNYLGQILGLPLKKKPISLDKDKEERQSMKKQDVTPRLFK